MDYSLSSDEILSKSNIDEQILLSQQQSIYYAGRVFYLKRKRNEFMPIGRLPADVLLRIFTMLSHDPARITDRWNWITLAHVCNRWRMVAMESGELWSNIVIRSGPLSRLRLENLLRLSKQSSLVLTVLQNENDIHISAEYLKQILTSHNERIRNLCLEVSAYTWESISASLGQTLHVLDVRIKAGSLNGGNLYLADSLKKIRFSNFQSRPVSFLNVLQTNNLRHLVFEYVALGTSQLPYILRHCPMLEHLSLVGCTTLSSNWTSDKISLKKLEKLSFRYMELGELTKHMSYMELPMKLSLTIECISGREFSGLLKDFSLGVVFKEEYSYKSLEIIVSFEEVRFEVLICDTAGGQDRLGAQTNYVKKSFVLRWGSKQRTTVVFAKVNELILQSCVKSATDIRIKMNLEFEIITEDLWTKFLEPLNRAVSLSVEFAGYSLPTELELFRSLRRSTSVLTSLACPKQFAFCPSLEELSFHHIHYSMENFMELDHSLRFRKAFNAQIKKLRIYEVTGLFSNYGASTSYIDDFSRHVQSFEWNKTDLNKENQLLWTPFRQMPQGIPKFGV